MTARAGELAATVGIVVGFLLLLFGGGLWVGIYVSDVRLALVVYGGLGCAVWLVVALVRPAWLPQSALTGAFAAVMTAFAISGATAWHPRLGLDYLAYAVLLTALYLLLVQVWRRRGLARRLDALIAILTVATAALYVVEVGSSWVDYWRLVGGLAVPPLRPGYAGLWLGNPNALASLLILLFLHVAAATGWGGRRRRIALVALGSVVAFDVLISGSRGAWLGVALAVAAGTVVWLASGANRARLGGLARRGQVRIAVTVGAVSMVVAGVLFGPAILDRLQAGAVEVRTAFWAASVRMMEDRPLTGLGPGSWAPARIPFTDAAELDAYVPHAHNVPLQVGAELGLVGLLAAGVVVVSLAAMVRGGLRHPSPEGRAFAWAALLGSTYLLGQSLVDAYIHQPAILLALALPIARLDAVATAGAQAPDAAGVMRRRLLAGVLLVAVLMSTAAAVAVEPAAKATERAASEANGGNWAAVSRETAGVVAAEPNLAPAAFLAGLAAAHADDPQSAAGWFERSAALDDFAPAWVDLAAARLDLGDSAGARTAMTRAMRLGRQQPQVAVAAAGLYRELGDRAAARDALAAALAAAPSLASDPFWTSPDWAAIADEAGEDAQARLATSWSGAVLALERGSPQLAAGIAHALGGVAGDDVLLASRAWQGDAQSFGDLVARARARPLDGGVVGLCRRVAEVGRSQGWTDWACDRTAPTDAYPVVRVGTPRLHQVMPGRELEYHAPYAYRRVLPQNLLVPWVLQLEATNP